ncbi:hypothetical protein BDV93DRAFT_3208 [Ceratobasidium sp. AG-I]|nr:hypothetical protein BDV93DRAFT_3208 [Ceratobasidium sp. AG-I]
MVIIRTPRPPCSHLPGRSRGEPIQPNNGQPLPNSQVISCFKGAVFHYQPCARLPASNLTLTIPLNVFKRIRNGCPLCVIYPYAPAPTYALMPLQSQLRHPKSMACGVAYNMPWIVFSPYLKRHDVGRFSFRRVLGLESNWTNTKLGTFSSYSTAILLSYCR